MSFACRDVKTGKKKFKLKLIHLGSVNCSWWESDWIMDDRDAADWKLVRTVLVDFVVSVVCCPFPVCSIYLVVAFGWDGMGFVGSRSKRLMMFHHLIFSPISGRVRPDDNGNWIPTGCSDRSCWSSNRSSCGRSCHRVGCKIVWKHKSKANVWKKK